MLAVLAELIGMHPPDFLSEIWWKELAERLKCFRTRCRLGVLASFLPGLALTWAPYSRSTKPGVVASATGFGVLMQLTLELGQSLGLVSWKARVTLHRVDLVQIQEAADM